MRLTLQEIRQRAIRFSHEWRDETSERAEAQSFWNAFFDVFGVNRRSVASFEKTVLNLKGAYDRIDVIWEGVLIGEHKSRGQDLDKASTQAFGYIHSLTRTHRGEEVPRYIVVSDFERIVLHDLESVNPLSRSVSFEVKDLYEHIRLFDFISGYESRSVDPEDPINIDAVAVLGTLHDELQAGGYTGHKLERFLVRILFCLFANDTGIFEPDAFKLLIRESREDGSGLGSELAHFFNVLNTPQAQRSKSLSPLLKTLPFVNGELFAEDLGFADFDFDMRNALLAASRFQWAKISPAVFGSLFQSIMAGEAGARKRRQIGAHYTSERDIMKVVRSLFMDDLAAEFKSVENSRPKLLAFHEKLSRLRFLDPACGCGNFLVIAYRELRRLELRVIEKLFGDLELADLNSAVTMNVDQMYGIEIEEWPARIAEVAMWLIDHQMNLEASQKFGKPLIRLPLKKSAKIVNANSLRVDWNDVLPARACSYILGNPPFVGKHLMSPDQGGDMQLVAGDVKGSGVLDYVVAWYFKAARYIRKSDIRCAFVSTNSITQGEQVNPLWGELFKMGMKIQFAHRTFNWFSEARGKAHVHVVIIGFGLRDVNPKTLTVYEGGDGSRPTAAVVKNISPYLIEGNDTPLTSRSTPICQVPPIVYGNKPADGGHLIIEETDRRAFLEIDERAAKYLRPLLCAEEYLHGQKRWCLWLENAPASDIRSIKNISDRVQKVRDFRIASKKEPTREKANEPALFAEIRQPKSKFIVVPQHTSELRQYIPLGYFDSRTIIHNSCSAIPGATLFHFGILSSAMHISWVRQVCGRIKSDFRYSNSLVYNNYPWPSEPTDKQKHAVERAAQAVLTARAEFRGQTLADLYDPLAMPKRLRDAHRLLDRSVDRCYRSTPFDSDRQRVEYLFGLYEGLTSLYAPTRKRKKQ